MYPDSREPVPRAAAVDNWVEDAMEIASSAVS